MGKVFKKPSYKAPTPAAAPAPAVEAAQMESDTDTTKKKKRQGKNALMVDSGGSGYGGTGVNL